MSPRRAFVVVLCSIALSAVHTAPARAGAWLLEPGEYYSAFQGSHVSAATFHDDNGDRVEGPLGATFEDRELASYNEIGWRRGTTFLLGIRGLSRTLAFPFPKRAFTQTGLADLVLGLRFKLIGGSTAVSLQADWNAPLGYDRDAFPSLGDGVQDVTGRLLFGTPLMGRGFVDVGAGYRYRFEAPLNELAVNGDLAIWIGPLLAAGRYDYVKSVESGTVPQEEIELHRVGPELTYRVDDHLDVFAGSSHTASARNAAHADRYYLGVAVKRTALGPLQGFLGGKRRL